MDGSSHRPCRENTALVWKPMALVDFMRSLTNDRLKYCPISGELGANMILNLKTNIKMLNSRILEQKHSILLCASAVNRIMNH